jgi:putative ABC transport system permease protein
VDVQIRLLDLRSDVWHPTVLSAADADGLPGVVLARKAAEDLGVEPGDTLVLLHPFRTGGSSFALRETEVRVIGVHPSPMRFLAYADRSAAGLFGLQGATNELQVLPSSGSTIADVKRDLFDLPGVALVEEPDAALELTGDVLDRFTAIFQAIAAFALLLALLIAFNSASISSDERAREHATMAAYGVRVRTLLRMAAVEGSVIGALGTLLGLGLGVLALGWLMARSAGEMPEIEMPVSVSPATIAATLLFGIVVVGLAPLLTARKLRRMDVPSTLRVME